MLTSQRLLKPAANYGSPLRTFQECFALRFYRIHRALPSQSSLPTRTCLLPNARHHRLQAPLDGTSSTQLTLKPDSTFTTKFSVGRRSAIWIWGPWASIASLMKVTTRSEERRVGKE